MANHIVSVGHRKKDVSMTLLSNAGGMFPACSVMNHSGVYVYYTKVQLRGQCVICMLTSVLNITFPCAVFFNCLMYALVCVLKLHVLFGQTEIHQLSDNISNVTEILWQCPV